MEQTHEVTLAIVLELRVQAENGDEAMRRVMAHAHHNGIAGLFDLCFKSRLDYAIVRIPNGELFEQPHPEHGISDR